MRRRGSRITTGHSDSQLRNRLSPAIFRAAAATVFLGIPTIDARFGAVGIPLVCVSLAFAALLLGNAMRAMSPSADWSLPVVDSVTLLLVVPSSTVAFGIGRADERLGGSASHVAAAVAVVIGCTAIAAFVAALLNERAPLLAVTAFLPAPFVVAAVLAGGGLFGADAVAQAISLAWIASAIVTLIDGVIAPTLRSLLAPTSFVLFALVLLFLANTQGGAVLSPANRLLALATTAICGALLLLMPGYLRDAPSRDVRGDSPPRTLR